MRMVEVPQRMYSRPMRPECLSRGSLRGEGQDGMRLLQATSQPCLLRIQGI